MRRSKTVNGTTITHIWVGGQIVADVTDNYRATCYVRGTNLLAQYEFNYGASPMNPGPLSNDVANSFRSSSYYAYPLSSDTIFYKMYSDPKYKVGSYMTRTPQNSVMQTQLDLALNPDWGNYATNMTQVTVPKGTVIYEGVAGPQIINGGAGQLLGGGNRVYIPEVDANWFN